MITLTKEQANKITRIDNGDVVTIPAGVFAKGDMLILFNNSDNFITLESKVENSYVSGSKTPRTCIEWPCRAIINAIFVDDNLLVVGVT